MKIGRALGIPNIVDSVEISEILCSLSRVVSPALMGVATARDLHPWPEPEPLEGGKVLPVRCAGPRHQPGDSQGGTRDNLTVLIVARRAVVRPRRLREHLLRKVLVRSV